MKKVLILSLVTILLFTAFLLSEGIMASETTETATDSVDSSSVDEDTDEGTIQEESSASEDDSNQGQSSIDENSLDGETLPEGEQSEEDLIEQEEGGNSTGEDSLIIKTSRVSTSDDIIKGSDGITMIKGDVEINAIEGLYYENENRAELEGDVILSHDKGEINSKKMETRINEDRYIFEDEVSMIQHLDDGAFTLESPYLELMKEDNSFKANKGVVIVYNGRTLKGDEVFYNDQEETLELISNVYIEEEDGDWVRSKQAVFYLKTEEFSAEGEVELEIGI
ncbi:MAG: LptA/OstA family protein [Halanaerobiales bacterium]